MCYDIRVELNQLIITVHQSIDIQNVVNTPSNNKYCLHVLCSIKLWAIVYYSILLSMDYITQ